jgi:hypothetical protein
MQGITKGDLLRYCGAIAPARHRRVVCDGVRGHGARRLLGAAAEALQRTRLGRPNAAARSGARNRGMSLGDTPRNTDCGAPVTRLDESRSCWKGRARSRRTTVEPNAVTPRPVQSAPRPAGRTTFSRRGPFRGPFLPADPVILYVKTGADARFHAANRQVAVLWLPLSANGVHGVASSNPDRGINLSDLWDDLSPVRHKHSKYRSANQLPIRLTDRLLKTAGA